MNTDSEEFLSRALADEARLAPTADGLAAAVRIRQRHRRRVAVALTGLAAAAVVVSTAIFVDVGGEPPVDVTRGGPEGAQTLPTSGWPGSGIAGQAYAQGLLAATDDGCFYLDRSSDDLPPLGLLWPQGWTWTSASDGTLEVRDTAGRVAMRPGDQIEFGGGFSSTPSEPRDVCGLGSGAWFPMNSDPTRVDQ